MTKDRRLVQTYAAKRALQFSGTVGRNHPLALVQAYFKGPTHGLRSGHAVHLKWSCDHFWSKAGPCHLLALSDWKTISDHVITLQSRALDGHLLGQATPLYRLHNPQNLPRSPKSPQPDRFVPQSIEWYVNCAKNTPTRLWEHSSKTKSPHKNCKLNKFQFSRPTCTNKFQCLSQILTKWSNRRNNRFW